MHGFRLGDMPAMHHPDLLHPSTGPEITVPHPQDLYCEHTPYHFSRGAIRFPLSQPVPVKLTAGIARLRAEESAELGKAKPQARAKKGGSATLP